MVWQITKTTSPHGRSSISFGRSAALLAIGLLAGSLVTALIEFGRSDADMSITEDQETGSDPYSSQVAPPRPTFGTPIVAWNEPDHAEVTQDPAIRINVFPSTPVRFGTPIVVIEEPSANSAETGQQAKEVPLPQLPELIDTEAPAADVTPPATSPTLRRGER